MIVRTLSERVFETLRDDIVAGRLGTGTPIRQDALAANLGVSKIPVREALARLEQVGLLTSRTNRGYAVPPMSRAQLDDIFALRLAVEPRAAAYAAGAADEAARRSAVAALARLSTLRRGDSGQLAAATREFHAALVDAGNRPLATQLVSRLLMLAERYLTACLPRSALGEGAARHNQALLKAWLARDAQRVERLLTRQLEDTIGILGRRFKAPP
ncbi:MAG TPA: GntR family transcriptional regulator [Steroidobacteraceae bacterium]|nr:GntR family transcriptional regulator [Steroidobacteraceae bacterium]